MSLKILPKKKNTAAEIVCNLSLINKTDLANIKRTLNEFGMVYFRNQNLNSKQYLFNSPIPVLPGNDVG